MESELHVQLDLPNRTPLVSDGIPPLMFSESHLRSSFYQLGTQNESMIGPPMLSSFLGDPFKNLHANRTVDGMLNRGNSNFHEGDSSLPYGSLGSTLAPMQQGFPSESPREMYSSNWSYASSSSVPTSLNCGCDCLLGNVNGKWDQNRFVIQNSNSQNTNHQWVHQNSGIMCSSLPYGTPIMSHNELSLSLATCKPSTGFAQSHARLGSDHSSLGNQELSLGSASSSRPPFSNEMMSGSGYLTALQQILAELGSFSLEGVDQTSYSTGLAGSSLSVSSYQFNDPRISFKGASELSGDDGSFEAPAGSSNRRQEVEAKKSQLLGLLELVDDCFSRCLDEIHTVISAFHAATELDPQVDACFALRTVSYLYQNFRERISNEILVTGMDGGSRRDNVRSFEKSFIQKQWALQQLKRKDQQLWRPQRGLPERSVSVLRAWMFENFLHPYPKDSEKHLLAIKSGLTRSQVSNWFINARVRIWKPLVEEMCAELNRRKGSRQNDEGTKESDNRRCHLSIHDYNQRFNT